MDGDMNGFNIAVGKRYTYFISQHYKYTESNKIEEGTSFGLVHNSNNLDPFAYHLEK